MTRRTLITILIGVAAAILVGFVWLNFFNGSSPAPTSTGSFGTSTNRTGGSATTQNPPSNIPSPVGQYASGGGTSINGGPVSGGGSAGSTGGPVVAPGVNWLAGGGTNSSVSGGSGTQFTPAAVNQLNNGQVGGTVSVLGTGSSVADQSGSNNSFLGPALAGAAIGTALCTAGLLGAPIGLAASGAGVAGAAASKLAAVPVSDTGTQLILTAQLGTSNALQGSGVFKANFLDCVTRTIAKAALQQITASVVNWINSGFNGQPSFVTNYQQFFTNVADQAAGAYIQGSALSFLCSPFQLKVKIAIAQSYAQRNAQSCSLSKVIGNIESFANGNFSQGGWGGLLQFTTIPTNNPYGAFAYGQIGLATAQQQAVGLKQQDLNLGQGFLSFTQPTGCTTVASGSGGGAQTNGGGGATQNCTGSKIVTPGKAIESSLANTLNVSQQTLVQAGVSGSFDAIISALIGQLTTRALYGGLSNLSGGSSGYQGTFLTPDQQQAQDQGNTLLTSLQSYVTLAQQYGQTVQGSIGDIENAQQQLSSLQNCWQTQASSTALTDAQQNMAASNAASANATLHSYDNQISLYNNQITRANTAIATLQGLQTRTLNVASTADITSITNDLNTAGAAGLLISQNDVTQAQQDRASLQTQLASLSTSVSSQLAQCNAFGQ